MNKLSMLVLVCLISTSAATNYPPPTNTNQNTNANESTNQNHVNVSNNVHSSNANQNSVNTTHYVNTAADAAGGAATAYGGTVGNVSSGSTSSATGGASSVGNTTSNSASAASADGAGANSNNVTMIENYEAQRIPVTTAYAASLTSGQDTCLGSASGGVQTQIVGISLGKTTVDKNCVMIKQVQLLNQMGMPSAACHRARAGKEGEEIDAAMRLAGVDCNSLQPVAVSVAASPPTPVVINMEPQDTSKFVTREELRERDDRILRRSIK